MSDAGSAGTDSAGAPDAGASSGGMSADVIPDFNGCTPEAYEDQRASAAPRVIGIAVAGLNFTPKCLSIRVGQTVRWEGSLASHPLAPGNPDDPKAGSPNTPIIATSSGESVAFTFSTPGTFPYQCELHAFGAGKGMAGVVHVTP